MVCQQTRYWSSTSHEHVVQSLTMTDSLGLIILLFASSVKCRPVGDRACTVQFLARCVRFTLALMRHECKFERAPLLWIAILNVYPSSELYILNKKQGQEGGSITIHFPLWATFTATLMQPGLMECHFASMRPHGAVSVGSRAVAPTARVKEPSDPSACLSAGVCRLVHGRPKNPR